MTVNNKFSFEAAVQSLACVLAQIKPTPWEKVKVLIKLPSMGKSIIDFMRKKIQVIQILSKSLRICDLIFLPGRFCRCIATARRKMQLEYFVWIIELKRRLSHLGCIFSRVDVNMKQRLCHIYFD